MYPCCKAVEGRTHIVGECETYKEERDVLEMSKIDECGMDKLDTSEYITVDSKQRDNDRYPKRYMVATDGETGSG